MEELYEDNGLTKLQPAGHVDWRPISIMLVKLSYQFLYHLIDVWLVAFQRRQGVSMGQRTPEDSMRLFVLDADQCCLVGSCRRLATIRRGFRLPRYLPVIRKTLYPGPYTS